MFSWIHTENPGSVFFIALKRKKTGSGTSYAHLSSGRGFLFGGQFASGVLSPGLVTGYKTWHSSFSHETPSSRRRQVQRTFCSVQWSLWLVNKSHHRLLIGRCHCDRSVNTAERIHSDQETHSAEANKWHIAPLATGSVMSLRSCVASVASSPHAAWRWYHHYPHFAGLFASCSVCWTRISVYICICRL